MNIVKILKHQRDALQKKVDGLNAAIAVLGGRSVKRKGRKMSAAARRKIRATQKANWRKKRAGK